NEVLMYFRSVRKSAGDVSLSESIETDGEGGALCLMDIVCLEEDMLERISRSELSGTINKLICEHLDEREREIIRLRYGLDGRPPKTQREVAKICDISRSYVSRIEKKALERLRGEMEGKGF
ncbi:MAG: sigma-70 family RNA polymerase sigma factor, partial [Oscillospiraceae bacterium]